MAGPGERQPAASGTSPIAPAAGIPPLVPDVRAPSDVPPGRPHTQLIERYAVTYENTDLPDLVDNLVTCCRELETAILEATHTSSDADVERLGYTHLELQQAKQLVGLILDYTTEALAERIDGSHVTADGTRLIPSFRARRSNWDSETLRRRVLLESAKRDEAMTVDDHGELTVVPVYRLGFQAATGVFQTAGYHARKRDAEALGLDLDEFSEVSFGPYIKTEPVGS